MHVFETRTTTGRGHFACQDSGVPQIFIPSISNGEKILGNAHAVVCRQVKRENSSLPVAVRVSKTRVLKLPIVMLAMAKRKEDCMTERRSTSKPSLMLVTPPLLLIINGFDFFRSQHQMGPFRDPSKWPMGFTV